MISVVPSNLNGLVEERRGGEAQSCHPTGVLCGEGEAAALPASREAQWWPGWVDGMALEPLQSCLVPLIRGSSRQNKTPPAAAVPDVEQQQFQAMTSVLMPGGQSW